MNNSTVATAASERRTQLAILMGKIEDRLGQISRLYNAADLDGAFFLDEFADHVDKFRRELIS